MARVCLVATATPCPSSSTRRIALRMQYPSCETLENISHSHTIHLHSHIKYTLSYLFSPGSRSPTIARASEITRELSEIKQRPVRISNVPASGGWIASPDCGIFGNYFDMRRDFGNACVDERMSCRQWLRDDEIKARVPPKSLGVREACLQAKLALLEDVRSCENAVVIQR